LNREAREYSMKASRMIRQKIIVNGFFGSNFFSIFFTILDYLAKNLRATIKIRRKK
jgi:hypothetical protein